MFDKTDEIKVLRDPIHGYIHIEYQVIWNALNTKEFQRLRRIHQLGGDFQVYHTAEHSRFSHSLGVYEIVRRMITENQSISNALNDKEKIEALCAALLHDLGHGPFSHFFEDLQNMHHEKRTISLLMDSSTEIHEVLSFENIELPQQICKILTHTHENPLLNQIISSQLDADRMDYLLRDAYETGTSYGNFDLERVLRTLRVYQGKLCVKESGMHSIEDYIMARYHMYWQVYLHPDAKSYEILIFQFFKRYQEIKDQYPISMFLPFHQSMMDNQDFLKMDECRMMVGFQEALESEDPILRDLSQRILDRHLFEWVENPDKSTKQVIWDQVQSQYDPKYYYYEDIKPSNAYLPYQEVDEIQTIWILTLKQQLAPMSSCSKIVKALLHMETQPNLRIYFPKEKHALFK